MSTSVSEKLRGDAVELRKQADAELRTFAKRIQDGGEGLSSADMERIEKYRSDADNKERQADILESVSTEPEAGVHREVAEVSEKAREMQDFYGKVARDAPDGASRLTRAIERGNEQAARFLELQPNEAGRGLNLNINGARELHTLRKLGVSEDDIRQAQAHGEHLRACRDPKTGLLDVAAVRAPYTAGAQDSISNELFPTYWEDSLYLFKSYVGGVRASGAEEIGVTGTNQIIFPKVTAYAAGSQTVPTEYDEDGAAITTNADHRGREIEDTTGHIALVPRAFRGYSVLTEEIIMSSQLDVRMQLALRGIGRALGLDEEIYFHRGATAAAGASRNVGRAILGYRGNESGAAIAVPAHGVLGLADAAALTARTVKTGSNTAIAYDTIPDALAELDAEYHMQPIGLSIMIASKSWFQDYVGAHNSNYGAVYPELRMQPNQRNLHGVNVVFSSLINSSKGDGKLYAILGSFFDGYLIISTGDVEIKMSTERLFLEGATVYKGTTFSDGHLRDEKALTWVTTDT